MKLSIVVIAVAFLAAAQGVRFAYKDCILVDVDGSLTITAKDENGTEVASISPELTEVGESSISGNCSGTGSMAAMTVQFGQTLEWRLAFNVDKDNNVVLDQAVSFTPSQLFNISALPGDLVSTSDEGKTTLSPKGKSYMCDAEQTMPFDDQSEGNFTFTVSQTIRSLKVQAFDVKNGNYSGDVVDCAADKNTTTTVAPSNTTTAEPTNTTTAEPTNTTTAEPTNTTTVEPTTEAPTTPATPEKGAYAVEVDNIFCIVVKGDIIISNISYTKTDNSTATAPDITVPPFNGTGGDVKVTGSCGNTSQQIIITFHGNWSLAMTFVKGGSKDKVMLGAGQDEYYVNDIALVYYLTTDFFPEVLDAGAKMNASNNNISGELWKAQVGGGSYKCDSDITESLSDGVQIKTSNLQTKAFNTDSSEDFNDDKVSECPADDESNSIVPIAVGAALAGLVVIVLIAYLIGRRRSRRQGYESV